MSVEYEFVCNIRNVSTAYNGSERSLAIGTGQQSGRLRIAISNNPLLPARHVVEQTLLQARMRPMTPTGPTDKLIRSAQGRQGG
jgi:hypothetical protein